MTTATKTETMTRHDIPASVKNLIAIAKDALDLDSFDIYELAVEFGADWRGLADRLCEYAFVAYKSGQDVHEKVVSAAERVWQYLDESK